MEGSWAAPSSLAHAVRTRIRGLIARTGRSDDARDRLTVCAKEDSWSAFHLVPVR
jgi:hypothetical protein